MNEDKTACQCGNCRHYDGIGDRCVIRPGRRNKTVVCGLWKPKPDKPGKEASV